MHGDMNVMFLSGSSKLLHTVCPNKICSIYSNMTYRIEMLFLQLYSYVLSCAPTSTFLRRNVQSAWNLRLFLQFEVRSHYTSEFITVGHETSSDEQEIGRAADENKIMIHRLSSFQPSGLSGFEWRTLIFFIKSFQILLKCFEFLYPKSLQYCSP
jgi:hypothetical protein